MYKLQKVNSLFPEYQVIIKLDSLVYIPPDLNNSHYQDYLKWLEEGNEPLPADA